MTKSKDLDEKEFSYLMWCKKRGRKPAKYTVKFMRCSTNRRRLEVIWSRKLGKREVEGDICSMRPGRHWIKIEYHADDIRDGEQPWGEINGRTRLFHDLSIVDMIERIWSMDILAALEHVSDLPTAYDALPPRGEAR